MRVARRATDVATDDLKRRQGVWAKAGVKFVRDRDFESSRVRKNSKRWGLVSASRVLSNCTSCRDDQFVNVHTAAVLIRSTLLSSPSHELSYVVKALPDDGPHDCKSILGEGHRVFRQGPLKESTSARKRKKVIDKCCGDVVPKKLGSFVSHSMLERSLFWSSLPSGVLDRSSTSGILFFASTDEIIGQR